MSIQEINGTRVLPAEDFKSGSASEETFEAIVEDEIARSSPDGRPPRGRRLILTSIAMLTACVSVLIGGVIAVVMFGAGVPGMIAAVAYGLVVFGLCVPVMLAGFGRFRDRVDARIEARRKIGGVGVVVNDRRVIRV